LQIGISTAVRERSRSAPELGIFDTVNFLEFFHSDQNPATLLQNENEIQENSTAKFTTIAISRLLSVGDGNVHARDQLAAVVCTKTRSAKTALLRRALACHPASGEVSLHRERAASCSATLIFRDKNLLHSQRNGYRSRGAGFIDLRHISGIDRSLAVLVFPLRGGKDRSRPNLT